MISVRELLISFCPAAVRCRFRDTSPQRILYAATWGGLVQFFLASGLLVLQLKKYFVQRAQQMSPHLAGASETLQAGVSVIVFLEFLIHPLSLLLLYFAAEGMLRFMAGIVTNETLPSLPVFLAFKIGEKAGRLRDEKQRAAEVADKVEFLPDGNVRIAAVREKLGWNASVTIAVRGKWFEVAGVEQAAMPRSFVYLLRPAAEGRVLRGYQEYAVASSSIARATGTHAVDTFGDSAKK
jgi:hypothetical protein